MDYNYLRNNLKPKNSHVLFFGFVVCIYKLLDLPGCELHMLAVTVLSYSVSEVCAVCQPGFLLTGISKAFP